MRGRTFCLALLVACGGTKPVDEPSRRADGPSTADDGGAGRDGGLDGTPRDGGGFGPLDGGSSPGEDDAASAHDGAADASDGASSAPRDASSDDAGAPAGRDGGADGGPPPPPESFVGLYENASGLPLLALIDAAQHTLDLELYEMHDTSVHAALRRALARGVRVRVVQEPAPIGTSCRPFEPLGASESSECVRIKNLIADVRAASGSYVPFAKDELCDEPRRCVQHGKLMLFDGEVALVSTGNFNPTSLCTLREGPENCNRDYTVVTDDGRVVETLSSVFEADLRSLSYDLSSVLAEDVSDKLTVSPLSQAPLLAFIDSAQRSIHIANQYFHEPDLNAALVRAAQRGVDVELVVSSFCFFGEPSEGDIEKETEIFEAFDAAGIRSRAFTARQTINGLPGYMHAKAIVIDEQRAWVGSVNGSVQATTRNREFGLFFADASWISELTGSLERDFRDPNTESWRESLACTKDW